MGNISGRRAPTAWQVTQGGGTDCSGLPGAGGAGRGGGRGAPLLPRRARTASPQPRERAGAQPRSGARPGVSRRSRSPAGTGVPPRLSPPRRGAEEHGRGATTFGEVFAGEPRQLSPPSLRNSAPGLRAGAAGREMRGWGQSARAGNSTSSLPFFCAFPCSPFPQGQPGAARPRTAERPSHAAAPGGGSAPPTLAGSGCGRSRPRAVTGPAARRASARRGGRDGGVGRETEGKEVAGARRPLYLCLRPRSRGVFPREPLPGRQQSANGRESEYSAAGPPAPLPSLRSRRIHKLLHRRQPQRSRLYRL